MRSNIELVKNGMLVLPDRDEPVAGDIYIKNGKIRRVDIHAEDKGKKKLAVKAANTINAKGMYVLPGLIDMHVHLREPGNEGSETIASGTNAAAAGGFTAVACMPNTMPPIDNQESVIFVMQRAQNCSAKVYPIGAVSKHRSGGEIAEIGEMVEVGAVAVSDDGSPVENADMMRRALEYAGMFKIPVISHAEDLTLSGNGCMNEGYESTRLGIPGIPRYSEEVCIARDIQLCNYIGSALHIAHVSTKGAVELIRRAKKDGINVTAEAAPHHFTLTDKMIGESFNTNLKMNPPLRTAEDVEAIIEGLKDGTLDCIASDHAPHPPEEKDVEFDRAPNGIVGLETSLSLVVTYLVRKKHLTWNELVRKMSFNPAKILRVDGGEIKTNATADLTLVDPKASWTVRAAKFNSISDNTPFEGWKLFGKVKYTILDGVVRYQD